MTQSRSQTVKELFHAAVDLSSEERELFLEQQCGADLSLRADVEKLLGCDSRVNTGFLQEKAPASMGPQQPERIGRFRIIRRIGEGGMGSVFEAQQDHPRRIVALKIIRMAMASETLRRRFEFEVQILGQLKHPGIAQIYEAGTHDDGGGPLPYFAMEYVQGLSLTDFARDHQLSTRERLSLMAEVCDAVQHAHQKGVVHRDLKPANILVESDGGAAQPKILDFGVARATGSDVQQMTMHTEVGQLVGTLSYMSPEQVAGRSGEVDVRSDVYALGVISYEMLADKLPYDLRGRSIPEAGTIIRDREPSRLSLIHSGFRGDVETIVAKAMEKEKERRYQSAAELADDLRRYLRDEPIVARPASRAYQIRKFAKRNRTLVGAIGVIFATLLVGIIGTSIALVRATRAERVALERSEESRRSAARATAINAFLQEMLSSVDPSKALGREVTIAQALDEAAAKIDAGDLKDQPDLEAELRTTIGTTYVALGKYPEAERQLQAALAIRRRLHPVPSAELATALSHAALVHNALGRHVEEEAALRESLDIMRRVHGDRHPDIAALTQSLGAALRRQGRYDEAERYYREALASRRDLLGEKHVDIAQTLNSLALLLQNKNDYAGAEPLFREALAMRRELLGDPHPIVADGLNNLANLLHMRGTNAEARALMEEALAMRRKLLGESHPQVGQSLNNLAWFAYETRDYAGAEIKYREALDIWRKTLPENHVDIANATAALGMVLLALEKYGEAESVFREVLAHREASLPEGHWQRFSAMNAIGGALCGQKKFEEAETLLLQGYAGLKDQAATPRIAKQIASERLVKLYQAWGKSEEAAHWQTEFTAQGGGSK